MYRAVTLVFALLSITASYSAAQSQSTGTPSSAPLRIGVVGLVHGHVEGFFAHNLQRRDIQIVGVAEADQQLFSRYAKQFGLDPKLRFSSLDEMLQKAQPQAVVVYTDTFDHRAVVETCSAIAFTS